MCSELDSCQQRLDLAPTLPTLTRLAQIRDDECPATTVKDHHRPRFGKAFIRRRYPLVLLRFATRRVREAEKPRRAVLVQLKAPAT